MLWILFAFMCLVAITFAIRPMLKDLPRLNALTGLSVVVVVAIAGGIYYLAGSPNVPSGRSEPGVANQASSDLDEMVAGLAVRLEQEPDNIDGWKMLGRSYVALGNFANAVSAFERAVELEGGEEAETLVALGEALALGGSQEQMSPRAVSVFENALVLEPSLPQALYWGGYAAVSRGDSMLAASRWERLLAATPPVPPEYRPQIQQQIAIWRGELPPVQASPPPAEPEPEPEDAIVHAAITLGDAVAALPGNTTVFVIARDPQQPSPPIAVVRRQLSEFPTVIDLDDGNSMVPGRFLSGFAEFELLARVSMTGSPAARSGDWFGSTIVRPSEQSEIDLSIDQQVP